MDSLEQLHRECPTLVSNSVRPFAEAEALVAGRAGPHALIPADGEDSSPNAEGPSNSIPGAAPDV